MTPKTRYIPIKISGHTYRLIVDTSYRKRRNRIAYEIQKLKKEVEKGK